MNLLCSFHSKCRTMVERQAQRNRTSLHDMEERSFLSILSDMIGFLKRFDIYKKKIFLFQYFHISNYLFKTTFLLFASLFCRLQAGRHRMRWLFQSSSHPTVSMSWLTTAWKTWCWTSAFASTDGPDALHLLEGYADWYLLCRLIFALGANSLNFANMSDKDSDQSPISF